MIILLTAIAVLITGVPLATVALVTLASRHEEHARSIAGRAPGAMAGVARRVLGFRATGITRPASRAVPAKRRSPAWLADECAGTPDPDPTGGPAMAGGSVSLR
jgi:hypothetical protein